MFKISLFVILWNKPLTRNVILVEKSDSLTGLSSTKYYYSHNSIIYVSGHADTCVVELKMTMCKLDVAEGPNYLLKVLGN